MSANIGTINKRAARLIWGFAQHLKRKRQSKTLTTRRVDFGGRKNETGSGGGDCVKIIILQIITFALFVGCIYEIMTMGDDENG